MGLPDFGEAILIPTPYKISFKEVIGMNWTAWKQGLIVALVTATLTVLINISGADAPPANWWTVVKLAVAPLCGALLAYVKQSPPPLG